MFEIGKWYSVWLVEDGDESQGTYRIIDFQAPLLRIHNPNFGPEMIVNTSSPMFVRAQLSKFQDEDRDKPSPIGILKSLDRDPPSRD